MEPMGPDDRNHEQALAVRRPVCDLSLRLFLGGIHACHERCSEYDSIWLRRQYALAKVSDDSSRPSCCSCSGLRHMSMEDYVLCKHIPYLPFWLWNLHGACLCDHGVRVFHDFEREYFCSVSI